jgi:uncharacterized protein YndB with AHSA1/START domain
VTASAHASTVVPASVATVMATLTDLARLPEWNEVMTAVIEAPDRLEAGAEWLVEFRAMGQTWRSRSTIEELDLADGRFVYRSGTDDGNPSYARWAWQVAEDGAGSRVTVTWELHPATFWRRVLLVRIRARQLARTEIPASLAALAHAAADRQDGQARTAEG